MSRAHVLGMGLGLVAVHACTVDFAPFRDGSGGGGGTASVGGEGGTATGGAGMGGTGGATTGGMGGSGGGAGGMGPDLSDLGTACEDNDDCDIGECCDDNECDGTCMVPCGDASDCPLDTMGCIHGTCLFPCSVDGDCEHADYVCHHECQWCEKKASQDCN